MNQQIKDTLNSKQPHLEAYRTIVGLDWADSKHDVCLLDLETNATEQFVVKHDVQHLSDFIARLHRDSRDHRVAIIIEQRRGAIINFLVDLDFIDIIPVDPNKLASFRKAIYPSGRKNDVVDSKLTVEYYVKHGHHLRPWEPDTPEIRELGFLNEDRRALVDERTKCVQKLGAALKEYYPLALELFDDLSSSLTCRFLKKWPTFEALHRVEENTIRNFFYAHNSRSGKKIEERLQAIKKAKPLTADTAVINAISRKVKRLAKDILLKNPEIQSYDKRIGRLYQKQKEAKIYASLPGAGAVMEPRLMVVFGTNRNRFKEATNVTEYTGVAPVTKESGESKKTKRKQRQVKFRFGAPKFQRQSMVEFAACTVQYCPWAKAYYQIKAGEGQGRHTILRGLAIKWARVIFRCWKNGEEYDNDRYLAALRKSGSPIWPKMQEMGLIN